MAADARNRGSTVARRVVTCLAVCGIVAIVGVTVSSLHEKGRDTVMEKTTGPTVLWVFEAPRAGAIICTPCVDGDVVYSGVIRDAGFSPQGAVYALNRSSGKPIWTFDDDGNMAHMYSSPRVNENS